MKRPKRLLVQIILCIQSNSIYRKVGRRIFRGIIITEASPADMAYIHFRLNRGTPHSPSPPNPDVTNLIAKMHGVIIGFIQLVRHSPSHYPYVGYWLFSLTTIHILFRGFGVGQSLCCSLICIAKQECASEIFLLVSQNNHPAINLYKKLGFEHTVVQDLEKKLEDEAGITGIRRITMVKRFSD